MAVPGYKQVRYNQTNKYDSHTRDYSTNEFQKPSTQCTKMIQGEILITQPEPLFRQTAVTVRTDNNEILTGVGYPNAFIDPITGNLHGTYEGPYPGQSVMVGFLNGNSHSPVVVNRYPYQGNKNTLLTPLYNSPMTRSMYDATDIIIGHFTGSVLSFNTGLLSGKLPGSVTMSATTAMELSATTDMAISALVTASVTATSTTINGDAELKLTGGIIQIKSTAQSMKTLIDGLFDVLTKFGTAGSPVKHVVDPATIALLNAEKAKWALLLEA
jgi:hypothetical protein